MIVVFHVSGYASLDFFELINISRYVGVSRSRGIIQLRQYEHVVGSFTDILCAAVEVTSEKSQCTASLGGCSIYMCLPGHVLAKMKTKIFGTVHRFKNMSV